VIVVFDAELWIWDARRSESWTFVSLPGDAKVFVNDMATVSTGDHRHYVSRGLRGGVAYSYKIRVEFEQDGKPAIENKLVRLRAGESVELAFGGAQPAAAVGAREQLTGQGTRTTLPTAPFSTASCAATTSSSP